MNDLLKRAGESLDWLVKDAQWRFDTDKSNTDEGGGYSPELLEAIEVLELIKKEG